jgi:hypothetical protein
MQSSKGFERALPAWIGRQLQWRAESADGLA